MLQVISGKIYGENEKHNNPKEIMMYSNVDLKTEQELIYFKIIPLEEETAGIFSYKIQFNNCIEHQSGGFSLIDVGSDVVIYQLKQVLSFFFDAYFDIDKYMVESMCREEITKARMKRVPSNYVRSLLEKNRIVEQKEIDVVQQLLQNLIALKRNDYENIMECVRSYCGSIKLLEEDPNLAYCVLVFVLESLSQDYNKYEPVWDDYNESIRKKWKKY